MGNCCCPDKLAPEKPLAQHMIAENAVLEETLDFRDLPPNEEVGELLKDVPLLAKLTSLERAKLGSALEEMKFSDGEQVIRQGDPGREFFIIKQGRARVSRLDANGKDHHLGDLQFGDYFGETALLEGDRRSATVKAIGSLICLSLDRSRFNSLFGQNKLNVQFAKRGAISAEQLGKVNVKHSIAVVKRMDVDRKKNKATEQFLMKALHQNILVHDLDDDQTRAVMEELYRQNVAQETVLTKEGEMGDLFYVVQTGSFKVTVNDETDQSKQREITVKRTGDSFGELALMYNSPRTATITALEDSVVWVVHRCVYRHILRDVSSKKLTDIESFLMNVDGLNSLAHFERSKITEALQEIVFPPGHVICKQGDLGDTFFMVYEGECVCTVTDEETGEENEVQRYHHGNWFGERALVKNEPRAATVKAVGTVHTLSLRREHFNVLLGPLEDILAKRIAGFDGEECKIEQKRQLIKVNKSDLVRLGILGKGSFGVVSLVKDKIGNTYALKAVSKAQIVQLGQQEHIMSEKSVLASLDCNFIVKLHATFKDENRLYFLLEACLGGELFHILRHRNSFDEDTSRFYASCVIQAFDYIHTRDIIYRDLKPENLMLDALGYIKVTDFGFAKIVPDRTWTLCGTPDYLAPEVVSGQGHGKGVDWWTLGVLIYEMLASYPPFYAEEHMVTYAKIMKGHVRYPSRFSPEAKDLIGRLLQHKPTLRLGVTMGGAKTIRAHAFFKGFDWIALNAGTIKAPILPRIQSPEDISNFSQERHDDKVPVYVDDGTNWDKNF